MYFRWAETSSFNQCISILGSLKISGFSIHVFCIDHTKLGYNSLRVNQKYKVLLADRVHKKEPQRKWLHFTQPPVAVVALCQQVILFYVNFIS